MSVQNIGKRIKSDLDLVLYERFPNSPVKRTLPAGKPSPLITSYLKSGYYQLEGSPQLYVKDLPGIDIVEPGAPDESSFISGLSSGLTDWLGNTGRFVSKQSGFLSEGFTESVGGLKTDFFDVTDQLKPIVWGVVIIAALWTLNKFID